MRSVVSNNPATSTAAVGVIVSFVGGQLGWDQELQAQVAQAFLAAAVVIRGLVAWWQVRHRA